MGVEMDATLISDFRLPDESLGIAITHVLELPTYLPVPNNSTMFLAEDRTPEWEGVTWTVTKQVLQHESPVPGSFEETHVMTTRLAFLHENGGKGYLLKLPTELSGAG